MRQRSGGVCIGGFGIRGNHNCSFIPSLLHSVLYLFFFSYLLFLLFFFLALLPLMLTVPDCFIFPLSPPVSPLHDLGGWDRWE